jgi:hypothetical protein
MLKRVLVVMITTFVLATAFALAAVPPAEEEAPDTAGEELALLVDWMSGYFSSAQQAALDREYYPIILVMHPVWLERSDAHWLYVEQAMEGFAAEPYRQRVYRVSAGEDGTFVSAVYELPEPERYVGTWRTDEPLAGLAPDDLIPRPGCRVILRRDGDSFSGSTVGSECESSLQGASYATSEVTITAEQVISWDRGYDAEGNQVWGAKSGPYIFDRVPPPEAADDAPTTGSGTEADGA